MLQALHVQRQYAISLLQDAHDYALYTLALCDKQEAEARDAHSHMSEEDRRDVRASLGRCSFIRSRAGAHALAALVFHHRARYLLLHPSTTPNVASPHLDPAECLRQRHRHVQSLLAIEPMALAKAQEDEFFNGRAGYLFALNAVYAHLSEEMERMDRGDRGGVGGEPAGEQSGNGEEAGSDRKLVDDRDDSKYQPTAEEEGPLMQVDDLRAQLGTVKAAIETVHTAIVASGSSGAKGGEKKSPHRRSALHRTPAVWSCAH